MGKLRVYPDFDIGDFEIAIIFFFVGACFSIVAFVPNPISCPVFDNMYQVW